MYTDIMPNLFDSNTENLLLADQLLLEQTRVPIVTVSASFRDDIELQHKIQDDINHPDVTLSRAHYSMALGVAVQAWGTDQVTETRTGNRSGQQHILPSAAKKAWLVDPTNYVSNADWSRVAFAETVGRILARHSFLNWVKQNLLDRFLRQNFPLTKNITPGLLFLTQNIQKPILSLHIVAGNILASSNKTVVQVVTDPHVRADYLQYAQLPTMTYCVFDDNTRYEMLEMAQAMGKKLDPERVIVTGPPIDPRIIAARTGKKPDSWRRRPLRVLLTTGGLGTNKPELAELLQQLLPLTRRGGRRKGQGAIQLMYYAGTNADHVKMVAELAKAARVTIGDLDDSRASLRVIQNDDIVDANNLLLMHGFPWADAVYCKPSGDMAYDAAVAGCALLFLTPWGEWEYNVQAVFTQLGIGRVADLKHADEQLLETINRDYDTPWLESALTKAHNLPPLFSRGAQNILNVHRRVSARTA